MTLGEVSNLYPGYDWVNYANNHLNSQVKHINYISLPYGMEEKNVS